MLLYASDNVKKIFQRFSFYRNTLAKITRKYLFCYIIGSYRFGYIIEFISYTYISVFHIHYFMTLITLISEMKKQTIAYRWDGRDPLSTPSLFNNSACVALAYSTHPLSTNSAFVALAYSNPPLSSNSACVAYLTAVLRRALYTNFKLLLLLQLQQILVTALQRCSLMRHKGTYWETYCSRKHF